jgi:hypothetical protein
MLLKVVNGKMLHEITGENIQLFLHFLSFLERQNVLLHCSGIIIINKIHTRKNALEMDPVSSREKSSISTATSSDEDNFKQPRKKALKIQNQRDK